MRLAVSPTGGGDFRRSQSVGSAAGGRGGAGPAERHIPGDPPSGPHARRSEQGGPRYGPTLPAGLITSWGRGQHSVPAPNPTHPSVRPRPGRRPFPCDPGRGRVRLKASQHPEEDSWTLRCPSKRAWPNGLAKASQAFKAASNPTPWARGSHRSPPIPSLFHRRCTASARAGKKKKIEVRRHQVLSLPSHLAYPLRVLGLGDVR